MPRPSQRKEQRARLLPIVARAFSELGYHRATTAEIARRCGVQENILYRLWKDKKEMFIASIDHVYSLSERVWTEQASRTGRRFSPEAILDYESEHLGEFGNYRIVFAGLSETDDAEIHEALGRMYRKFQAFIRRSVEDFRKGRGIDGGLEPELAAWALVGLGTVFTIGRELGLMEPKARKRLLSVVGKSLLERG